MNLNVGIQIQLWRVTTFHKIHCVIDYTIVVIDYQWIVLKKKLRVITLNMIFSKVITLPMVFFTRYEESIKARPWHAFYKHPKNTYLFQIFSDHCPLFFLCKNSCQKCFLNFGFKTLFFLQVEILQKTKVCYLFFLLPLTKRIQRTNRLRILLILPPPSEQKISKD